MQRLEGVESVDDDWMIALAFWTSYSEYFRERHSAFYDYDFCNNMGVTRWDLMVLYNLVDLGVFFFLFIFYLQIEKR